MKKEKGKDTRRDTDSTGEISEDGTGTENA
jgi:hypothetical protein